MSNHRDRPLPAVERRWQQLLLLVHCVVASVFSGLCFFSVWFLLSIRSSETSELFLIGAITFGAFQLLLPTWGIVRLVGQRRPVPVALIRRQWMLGPALLLFILVASRYA